MEEIELNLEILKERANNFLKLCQERISENSSEKVFVGGNLNE